MHRPKNKLKKSPNHLNPKSKDDHDTPEQKIKKTKVQFKNHKMMFLDPSEIKS